MMLILHRNWINCKYYVYISIIVLHIGYWSVDATNPLQIILLCVLCVLREKEKRFFKLSQRWSLCNDGYPLSIKFTCYGYLPKGMVNGWLVFTPFLSIFILSWNHSKLSKCRVSRIKRKREISNKEHAACVNDIISGCKYSNKR